jgi:hypothetical protein
LQPYRIFALCPVILIRKRHKKRRPCGAAFSATIERRLDLFIGEFVD